MKFFFPFCFACMYVIPSSRFDAAWAARGYMYGTTHITMAIT